tara:strand:+ start:229 stop:1026 length:798 start_codon:yes stop_codon:yes gene_type:complete
MYKKLEKLLCQRVVLNDKKYKLVKKLEKSNFFDRLSLLGKIHLIINKQLSLNKKVRKSLLNVDKRLTVVIEPVYSVLQETYVVLNKQNKVFYKINFLTLLSGGYFKKCLAEYRVLYSQEIDLNHVFVEKKLFSSFPESYDPKKLKNAWKLLLELQSELRIMVRNVGNTRVVKAHGKHALKLISLIQKTELYGFIQNDVEYVKKKVKLMIKNPKENKLAYVLGTFYIVSPGTFELTGAVLFVKYIGQYSYAKVKKIKGKALKYKAS